MAKRTLTAFLLSFFTIGILCAQKKSISLSHSMAMKKGTIDFVVGKKDYKKLVQLLPIIDSVLQEIDQKFSILNPTSYTSVLNQQHEVIASADFMQLFQSAYEISNNTKGSYSPTDYAYESYWISRSVDKASKADSNNLDTIYKYNVFSGFMSGDSFAGADTFHLLFMDDFIFKVSLDNLLPGYKMERINSLLHAHLKDIYQLTLNTQIFYARNFLNASYSLGYNSSKPNEYALNYKQNFAFNRAYYTLLRQSNEVRLWTADPIKACAYAYAMCNTKLNNNHAYWKGLLHFETNFK